MPSLLALAMSGLELPPLHDNLPPLELGNNQPPVGRPPLEVVLSPLEGELSGGLPVLLVLCCVVPLLFVLSSRASFGYSTLPSEEKASEK